MLVPRQEYPRELKVACMRELDSGKGLAEVARQYQLSPKRLETGKGEWHYVPALAPHLTHGVSRGVPSGKWPSPSGAKE